MARKKVVASPRLRERPRRAQGSSQASPPPSADPSPSSPPRVSATSTAEETVADTATLADALRQYPPPTKKRKMSSCPASAPSSSQATETIITSTVPLDLFERYPQFHTDEGIVRLKRQKDKKIYSGRSANLSGENHAMQTLKSLFEQWLPFFQFLDSNVCYDYPVRCFNCNASHVTKSRSLESFFVRPITITPDLILRLIGMPNTGADVFSCTIELYPYSKGVTPLSASTIIHGNEDPRLVASKDYNALCFLCRCIARLIGGTIFCKMGNHDTLRGCHKLLTYLIMVKVEVNIPLLLIRIIQYKLDGRSSYPHGIISLKLSPVTI